jgi:hypothetical protein
MDASRLGALAAFAGASADQLALKFGKPAKDSQHKPPVRRRGVRQCVAKRMESSSGLRDHVEHVQEVARHKNHVAVAFDGMPLRTILGPDRPMLLGLAPY